MRLVVNVVGTSLLFGWSFASLRMTGRGREDWKMEVPTLGHAGDRWLPKR
jgi:hypothetical protein